MTGSERTFESWPAGVLTVEALREVLRDLPGDLPLMAQIPDYEHGGWTTIDVVEAERAHTLRPEGQRPEILLLHCAAPGESPTPQPSASVLLQHHGLGQHEQETLSNQVLRVTRWGIEKSSSQADYDEETGVMSWGWYGRRGPDHARAAHAFLSEQATPEWVITLNVPSFSQLPG